MRLFVALALPEAVKAVLTGLQQTLAETLPEDAVRWTRPEQQHLTLAFLGQVSEERLPALREALALACRRVLPYALQTAHVGAFPSLRRASVLWCGVAGDVAALRELQGRLAQQLRGFYTFDERGFNPHLTLGRVKGFGHAGAIAAALAGVPKVAPLSWTVEEVRLYSSNLHRDGARYTTLYRQALA